MDATVVVAAMGLVSTLTASGLGAYWQRKSSREARVFGARVEAYGELVAALFEYERATFNRVKTRLAHQAERDTVRQEAWANNARARTAISVVALLSGSTSLRHGFEDVRTAIGDLNKAQSEADLRRRHEEINAKLDALLVSARADLTE